MYVKDKVVEDDVKFQNLGPNDTGRTEPQTKFGVTAPIDVRETVVP